MEWHVSLLENIKYACVISFVTFAIMSKVLWKKKKKLFVFCLCFIIVSLGLSLENDHPCVYPLLWICTLEKYISYRKLSLLKLIIPGPFRYYYASTFFAFQDDPQLVTCRRTTGVKFNTIYTNAIWKKKLNCGESVLLTSAISIWYTPPSHHFFSAHFFKTNLQVLNKNYISRFESTKKKKKLQPQRNIYAHWFEKSKCFRENSHPLRVFTKKKNV